MLSRLCSEAPAVASSVSRLSVLQGAERKVQPRALVTAPLQEVLVGSTVLAAVAAAAWTGFKVSHLRRLSTKLARHRLTAWLCEDRLGHRPANYAEAREEPSALAAQAQDAWRCGNNAPVPCYPSVCELCREIASAGYRAALKQTKAQLRGQRVGSTDLQGLQGLRHVLVQQVRRQRLHQRPIAARRLSCRAQCQQSWRKSHVLQSRLSAITERAAPQIRQQWTAKASCERCSRQTLLLRPPQTAA